MSTTFLQQAASLPTECVARRLSYTTKQPACAQAVAIRRKPVAYLGGGGGGGGGLGCSSTPLAQAVLYIVIEASGSGPASPGFSKRDHFFWKYYA